MLILLAQCDHNPQGAHVEDDQAMIDSALAFFDILVEQGGGERMRRALVMSRALNSMVSWKALDHDQAC